MTYSSVLFDLEDDPKGNVWHCLEHGVTTDEIVEVLQNPADTDISRKTGRKGVFGWTNAGRHLIVVFEEIDRNTAYPVTAYEVAERTRS